MPSEGRGRKTGNPVLRLPGRHGKKGCLAGNITMKSWRTEDDVPAVVTSENGRVWLYCLAPQKRTAKIQKVRFASGYESVGQNAGAPCGKEGIIV